MDGEWRQLEAYLPACFSPDEVRNELRIRVIAAAADGGEFVGKFKVGPAASHSDYWIRWQASYLPGPPGVLGIDVLEGA